jgi:hypothetical protein
LPSGCGSLPGPDLQCAKVVSVLLESRLLERKDNPLTVIEISVSDSDHVGEMNEAAAWHLGGIDYPSNGGHWLLRWDADTQKGSLDDSF